MLMSVIEGALSAPAYPDLAGKRVLLTGVRRGCGVDIARAFAEHRVRIAVQFAEASPAMQAVAEIVAPAALEAQVYGPVGAGAESATEFARTAVQAFGGLDVVVNLVPLETAHLDPAATFGGCRPADRRPAGAAAADLAHRRQPHERDLDAGADPQRGHPVGPHRRRQAGLRHARQVEPGGHDPGAGRGVGAARHPLQRHRARRPCRPSRALTSPAKPTWRRWRSTWPPSAARRCRAACSRRRRRRSG